MAHGRRKITGRATTFRDILYVLRGVTQGCAYFMECIDVAIRALEVVDEIVFAFGRGQLTVLVGAAIEAGNSGGGCQDMSLGELLSGVTIARKKVGVPLHPGLEKAVEMRVKMLTEYDRVVTKTSASS
ncbi:MAG: hypothetical protein DMG68_17030 [Acidobacteria bacterium]|nr:MAG: hypothetical protein DMG68_17030 [Acidobacteriota bacterium]